MVKLKTVTISQYPRLYELLFSVAMEGEGAYRVIEPVSFVLPDTYDFAKMEHTLLRLSSDEFVTFRDGNDDELNKLVGKYPGLSSIIEMFMYNWRF
jgi:hypothetical protein